jgi:sugar lactone lactonase YvrE
MKRHVVIGLCGALLSGATLLAQGPLLPPGASPQATQDPGYNDLISKCMTPAPAAAARPGGAGAAGAGRPGGAPGGAAPATPPATPPAFPPPPADYTVSAIPGVIAAGQKWTKVWEVSGNNADGILSDKDGNLLIAQNHNSAVVKLDYKTNQPTTVYKDTHTGGALSMNKKGDLFIVQRGLHANVSQLAPKRQVVADKLPNGDPLDCLRGVINDLTADSKGGAYFTMGGLFYASPKGVVTRYGENLNTNGVILSADEKTLYVTNGAIVYAFDVDVDGALTNQREFGKLQGGTGGDGSAVDQQGRVYVATGSSVDVFAADGKFIGTIPGPQGLHGTFFGGRDKKTLYGIVFYGTWGTPSARNQIIAIPTIAQGYTGRSK